MFLPDEALPLVIMVLGLALMLGLLSIRNALGLIGVLVISIISWPILDPLIDGLPWWVIPLLVVFLGLSILRQFASSILGAGAADEMVGNLAAGAVRMTLRLAVLPVRLLLRSRRGL